MDKPQQHPDSRQWGQPASGGQLHMIWPRRLLDSPPKPCIPEDYLLRTFRPADIEQWAALMTRVGFKDWNAQFASEMATKVLPDGIFFVEHRLSGKIAATALALPKPTQLHPDGGELGWVACDPQHAGKGLGMAASAAAIGRFIAAGFREIYLMTDDWRLPAIKTYLKMGFEPLFYAPDMKARWQDIFTKLGRKT
ncbi:MAG: GNAT family N-acetyltransferase [Planctomycetes bacterium]|nr:GNAT family N-acetyltransferase [Planctomycetota bacterium]